MNFSQKTRDVLETLRQHTDKSFTLSIDDVLDPEVFLLDALDILCQENISEYGKLQLLTILQEQIEWDVLNITSAEHVIGSLKNMFLYPTGNDSQFYKSQLLGTLTTVLVMSSSKLQNLQENCETLHSSIQFLTDVMSKVNHQPSALTRKTACECLWEIELSYPGLLQDRLGTFFRICDMERSVIFQSYMMLFVTTLKNAIVHISTFHEKFPENPNFLNELLSSETDLSMKMNYLFEFGAVEDQFPVIMNVGSGNYFDITLPSKFNNKELKRAVSYIVENCNFLTNIPLFHVLLQLMHCIKLASLSHSVFKAQFVNNLSTMTDLPLFQLVLLLMSTFGTQLFEEADSVILLHRLSSLSNQPHLQIGQRLLCYKWLTHFPYKSKAERPFAELMDFTQKANFHPTVFDPLEIIPGKLDVLSSCYFPGDGPDIATATLMNCLICLHKPIKRNLKRPYAAMLFQVLFSYYARHHDTALVQEIYRFLLSFVTEHPDLVPYILDFTFSVSRLTPESFLPCEVLRNFTDYIVALPLKQQLKNIRNYLKTFEFAMKLKDIPPNRTVGYLLELVKAEEMYRAGGWSVGNGILQVCRNILQYHDTSNIIAEFGECLLTINKVYTDVDISDRAMFYYSLLTSISPEKCSKLLTGSLSKVGQRGQSFGHTDLTTSAFAMDLPIKETQKPFLLLTRISKSEESSEQPQDLKDLGSVTYDDCVSSYLNELDETSDQTCIPIPFYFHYSCEPCEEVPDTIFAVVIQFYTSSNYRAIADIHVPYLSYSNSNKPSKGCQVVQVKFSPKEPVPALINVRVIYSKSTGCSFIVPLKPINIRFPDLFIPFGQQTTCLPNLKHILSPKLLFDYLWEYIEGHQYSRKNQSFTGAKSIVYIKRKIEKDDVIMDQLVDHIINQTDSELLVGVVLPPKHHLLLKFVVHSTHTVVYVKTDRWQILGLVAEFLNTEQEMIT